MPDDDEPPPMLLLAKSWSEEEKRAATSRWIARVAAYRAKHVRTEGQPIAAAESAISPKDTNTPRSKGS